MTPPASRALSDDNKALVTRLFDEVFSAENLDAADEIWMRGAAQRRPRRRSTPL